MTFKYSFNYSGLLNSQAKAELSKFTMKDVNSLKVVANKASQFTSFAQLQDAVLKASPQASKLAQKATVQATKQFNQVKSKLSPNSQNFFSELAHLSKNFAVQAQKLFQKQDPAVKANLGQVFHHATAASKTPAGKAIIQHLHL